MLSCVVMDDVFYPNQLPITSMCDTYTNSAERSSCINGVFMENFNTIKNYIHQKFLKQSDYPIRVRTKNYHKTDAICMPQPISKFI